MSRHQKINMVAKTCQEWQLEIQSTDTSPWDDRRKGCAKETLKNCDSHSAWEDGEWGELCHKGNSYSVVKETTCSSFAGIHPPLGTAAPGKTCRQSRTLKRGFGSTALQPRSLENKRRLGKTITTITHFPLPVLSLSWGHAKWIIHRSLSGDLPHIWESATQYASSWDISTGHGRGQRWQAGIRAPPLEQDASCCFPSSFCLGTVGSATHSHLHRISQGLKDWSIFNIAIPPN